MSRSKKPRFRGHTPRSVKLKAIATALASCISAAGFWLLISDALSNESVQLRRNGSVYRWSDDPIVFAVGIAFLALLLGLFALGSFAALRNINWRNWRH